MRDDRFLGIDFSGAAAAWKPRTSSPTVWIATIDGARLTSLKPVQNLSPGQPPFDALVDLLAAGDYRAAGIDAPCCLPARHMPKGGHAQLLADIAKIPPAPDRPFPMAADLLALATGAAPLLTAKPTRATEDDWRRQGVNVRSTLWAGPRGGAAFTAACLTLLARAQRPVWPWHDAPGMIVEAFPAAQLRAWGLPHTNYGPPSKRAHKTDAERAARRATRASILAAVKARTKLHIPRDLETLMQDNTDALDALLAAFGAKAAATGALHLAKPPTWKQEGAIAVHA
jgi:hypothetical protein